jgi:myo-inositol-1(or 4)-monophosphatase
VRSALPRTRVRTDTKAASLVPAERLRRQLDIAREAAAKAGEAIKSQFGSRTITTYKGSHDVQLKADIVSQDIIFSCLSEEDPAFGFVAEEEPYSKWPGDEVIWAVDPLDGTNNFGYGIAHCAIAISLFSQDSVVLALVSDPLTDREFYATQAEPMAAPDTGEVPMSRATVSLVTSYSRENRIWGSRFTEWIGGQCKRVTSLWAPALDLALVATGALDAMVCHEADLLDVCGGAFLVKSVGGHIVDFGGQAMEIDRSMHRAPVSFVAGRSARLVSELVETLRLFDSSG